MNWNWVWHLQNKTSQWFAVICQLYFSYRMQPPDWYSWSTLYTWYIHISKYFSRAFVYLLCAVYTGGVSGGLSARTNTTLRLQRFVCVFSTRLLTTRYWNDWSPRLWTALPWNKTAVIYRQIKIIKKIALSLVRLRGRVLGIWQMTLANNKRQVISKHSFNFFGHQLSHCRGLEISLHIFFLLINSCLQSGCFHRYV